MAKYFRLFLVLISISSVAFEIKAAEESLSWKDCMKEAAKNNPDLIAAGQVVKQSDATRDITASALYPQINANLNASTAGTSSTSSSSGSTTASSPKTTDSYSYGVTGSQLVFDGLQTINNVKSARESIRASQEAFKFTSVTVRYNLRSAFINLLKTQENLLITQEIYKIRRSNLELITLRYESGLEHKGALLTAQADLANAVYGIAQARRNVEVAQRQLVKAMGRKQLTPIEVKGDFMVKNAAKAKPDFVTLSKNNPSLLQVIAQKNAAVFTLRSAYGAFSPTLTADAQVGKASSLWPPRQNEWNAGLALTMPIFEGNLRFAQISKAQAALKQLEENERSTRDGIVTTLEQAWAALQDAMQNVEVQKGYLVANEERSKIAQAQYSIGFISFDNWTIIEDNLVQSKSKYLDARAVMLLAEANWIQAKGETLEYE